MQNILCIPNCTSFQTGIWKLPKNLLDAAKFLPRESLETDETRRQICTYTLIWSGPKLLTYRRRGSEGRLHDKVSIGVGGHVDEMDCIADHWFAIYRAASREIKEELGVKYHVVGTSEMVIDNTNGVGRVHLGVLFQIRLIELPAFKPSEEIAEVNFLPPEEIPREELEGWSRLVLDWLLSAEGE